MKLPYIERIELQVNYIYLTDKLMGIKVLDIDKKSVPGLDTYIIKNIGSKNEQTIRPVFCGSDFATNNIVRNGATPIHAFLNEKIHDKIYMTDLFIIAKRKSSNIYDKNCAFFSAIIDKFEENKIKNKYSSLNRSLMDYDPPF
jgi:hypothetical protein